jgi:hypothetical protein
MLNKCVDVLKHRLLNICNEYIFIPVFFLWSFVNQMFLFHKFIVLFSCFVDELKDDFTNLLLQSFTVFHRIEKHISKV